MEIRSCITDKPIENNSEDKLTISRFDVIRRDRFQGFKRKIIGVY
jgi:hypothetical protein